MRLTSFFFFFFFPTIEQTIAVDNKLSLLSQANKLKVPHLNIFPIKSAAHV